MPWYKNWGSKNAKNPVLRRMHVPIFVANAALSDQKVNTRAGRGKIPQGHYSRNGSLLWMMMKSHCLTGQIRKSMELHNDWQILKNGYEKQPYVEVLRVGRTSGEMESENSGATSEPLASPASRPFRLFSQIRHILNFKFLNAIIYAPAAFSKQTNSKSTRFSLPR